MKWADEVRDMKVLSSATLLCQVCSARIEMCFGILDVLWVLKQIARLDVVPSHDVLANVLDFKS